MRNPLIKWFFVWLGIMLTFSMAYYFIGPKGNPVSLNKIDFSTTQSSELYFKNIRSYFYDLEEHEESNFKIYRLRSLKESGSNLKFMIVHNWKMNEAYILLDNEKHLDAGYQLLVNDKDTLDLPTEGAVANYRFAAKLFYHIEEDQLIEFLHDDQKTQLGETERNSLKKTLNDYFKLVGRLR